MISKNILTKTEREQILVAWNKTRKKYPGPQCLHQLAEDQAGRTPEAVAVISGQKSITYQELNSRANQLAHRLQQLGVGPDVPVAVCLERSIEMTVGVLAILKAGGGYVSLDPVYPQECLAYMLQDCRSPVLLTQQSLTHLFPTNQQHIIRLDTDWGTIATLPTSNPISGVGPQNLLYILYTSGSTGKPKGVSMIHGPLVNLLCWQAETTTLTGPARALQFASLGFDVSCQEIFFTWSRGGTLVLIPEETRRDAYAMLRFLADTGTEQLFLPFAALQNLAQAALHQGIPLHLQLKEIVTAGEQLQATTTIKEFFRRLPGCALHNQYGLTEAHVVTAFTLPNDPDTWPTLPPIGRPIANTQMYILDDTFQSVPVSEPGELYIAGDCLARGYLNRPELTAEKFIINPFSEEPGARMYRTGDLARWLPDGKIEYLGRIDQQVNIRGFCVELDEIETALRQHPSLRESAVLAREDTPGQRRLVAYVVPQQGQALDFTDLRSSLKNHLAEYMVPAVFVALDALPLTRNCKVDRKALPAPDASANIAQADYAAPRTAIESALAEVWAEVLKVERVSIHDNFFDLGGHSLLATQIVSRLRKKLGLELSIRSLFETASLAELACQLEQNQQAGSVVIQPVSRQNPIPFAFAQQRLWFLDQFERCSVIYNIPAALQLRGTLNVLALERAFAELIVRHESLRTVSAKEGDQPNQGILSAGGFDLPLLNLTALPPEQRDAEAAQIATREARAPFDLASGPRLLRLSAQEHILLLNMSDGWSLDVFSEELVRLYAIFSVDSAADTPLLHMPIQYADFSVWQKDWLRGEAMENQLGYWRKQLTGAPALLDLPTDRPRPACQTFNVHTLRFQLSRELSRALQALSRQHNATLFMTLYAAFASLLSRYSRQDDLVIGSGVANRNRAEVENLIGFFVNTLALRADLSGNPSFAQLLAQARQTTLDAYAHQDIPFEKLVEELRPERSLSYSPICQVMFVMQTVTSYRLDMPSLEIHSRPIETGTAKFDLTLDMTESENGLFGFFEYNTDLFDESTVQRMLGHFETLLTGIVSDPTRPVKVLPLLTEAEKQTLAAWNNTRTDYPQEKTIHQLFEEQAAANPDQVALVFDPYNPGLSDETLTYRELNQRANQLAHHLKSLGVGPECRVGIFLERSSEIIIGILGIWKAGGAYVPLDPEYPKERLAYMLEDSRANILLTQVHLQKEIPAHNTRVIYLDTDWLDIAKQPTSVPQNTILISNLAYIIYTSGSTGKPKGVLISHRGLFNVVTAQQKILGINNTDRILQLASLNFDASVFEIVMALGIGASLYLGKRETILPGPGFVQFLKQSAITALTITPTALAATPTEILPTLRIISVAGEACPAELVSRWAKGRDFFNLYGPTESTIWATAAQCDENNDNPPSIGQTISNTQTYILDENWQPVPVGIPGELYIAGIGLARGYLNRPDLTAERFIPNPFSLEPGARMYRTGDLARWLPDGNIEYLGRIDHQVKIRGFRIELVEIEAVLAQHPDVREAVVLAREDTPGDKRLVAYVVASQHIQLADLRNHLKAKLPEYMVPSAFVFLEAFPLTPNGKLDRKALPAPDTRSLLTNGYVAPRTPAEELLASIWADVLKLDRVGVHDNFFELGGHSLLATQVVSRIRKIFRVDLSVRSLFETPSLSELAASIDVAKHQQRGFTPSDIQPVARDIPLPLSFAQERLWFLDQFEGSNATYNIPTTLHLTGALDVLLLEKAIAGILLRHEALRTTFSALDNRSIQQIAPYLGFSLPITDLSALPADEQTRQAQSLVEQDAIQPFDLTTGPLFRVSLLRLAEQDHLLLLNMHHIISDGWSMGILFHELSQLYQGRELPPLPIQYADFAAWQRTWLAGETLERQVGYWKNQLCGAPALLELPTDHPRPSVQTFRGKSIGFELSPELTQTIKALARQHNATLFMALQAAFAVLLSKYSRQDDIVIGSPIANRNQHEIEPLIGFFVNTLALRTNLSGDPTFSELLQQVQRTTLDAYAHQDIPFEKLVEALNPERTLRYSPIFQVMFVLQNTAGDGLQIPGLQTSSLPIEGTIAKFDLTLSMFEMADRLVGGFEFNTDLFEPATIQRLIGHWQTLLEAIVAHPEQKIARLPLLTQAERQQILVEWNNTRTIFPSAQPIHRMVEAWAQTTPNQPAVVFNSQAITYHELDSRANQLAHHLRKHGIGPDVPVAICTERSIEMVIGLLGILKAGGAYTPIDPEYPPERITYILQDSGSPILLTQDRLYDKIANLGRRAICLDRDWPSIAQESPTNLTESATADHLAYVIYTSGSTGQPKGVQVTHRTLGNLIGWHKQTFGLSTADHISQIAGTAFDASAFEIWPCLTSGASLYLITKSTRLSLSSLRDWLLENKITVGFLPTPLAESILDLEWPAQTALRFLLTGGDKLHRYPSPDLPFSLGDNYGPTENTIVSTFFWVPAQPDSLLAPSIGSPISNVQTYILDPHLEPVPAGIPGELYVAGDNLARGYLNRPTLTAEKFTPNPFSDESGGRMYRTGDLARWLPNGNIEFLGRIDQQVKIRGFRIELGEIEAALAAHPSVLECVVLARQDAPVGADKKLVAYAVPHIGRTLNEEDLRTHLKSKLPPYMLPAAFVLLETFPLTPNGKVDRRALPAPTPDTPQQDFSPPRTDLEKKIAAAWQKALGKTIGLDDNFFSSGGDSLRVVRVVHHLNYACSVMDIFEHQTTRELAEYLSAQEKAGAPQTSYLLYDLTPRIPPQQRTLSLVCFPPAGGNAIIYKELADQLPKGYSLYAVEMPGHDIHKPNEALLSWSELATRCVNEIKATVSGPIALYGHSAGASLALEVARLLEQENLPLKDVYLGASFPNVRVSTGIFRKLNLERLVSDRTYEDAQRQVVGSLFDEFDPQARAVRTRSWRHDGLENTEYYTFAAERWKGQKLRARITSVVGEKDRSTEFYAEQVNDWHAFGENVYLRVIPHAGHYFMKHQAAELAAILTQAYEKALPTPAPRAEPHRPGVAQFMTVATGQFISTIGTIMSAFALGAWVYKTTGSVTKLGVVSFFEVLPLLLLLPIAGAIADRWDRRKILLLCDGAAILNTLLLGILLFTGSLQLWHLWLCSGIYATISAFQQPAYLAGVAQLVPKRYLGQANGFVQLGQAVGNVLAPLLGGALIEAVSLPGVVTLDLFTYLFSFTCLALTPFPNTLFKKEEEPVVKAIGGGWKYLLRRRGLLALAVYFAGMNVGNSTLSVLLIPYVLSISNGNWLGLALASWGLGMSLGSVAMIVWGGLRQRIQGIIGGIIAMSAFTVMVGFATSPWLLCLGLLGNGLCFSLAAGHFYPLLQVKVGEELLGRILSTFRMISYSSLPIAYLLVGPLADGVFTPLAGNPTRGMGLLLISVGALVIAWSLLAFLYNPLRQLETDIPDAMMEAVIDDDKDALQKEADKLAARR